MLFSRMVELAEALEHGDREHRDRNRRRDGQARAQREIDGDRAEDDAEDRAEDDRLDGELGGRFGRRNVRLEGARWRELAARAVAEWAMAADSSMPACGGPAPFHAGFRAVSGAMAARAVCDNRESCESREQTPAGPRTGLRAHDEPPLDLPALPDRARGGRRRDDLLAGARGAVQAERGADPEGPRLLRRVRRARRRLLREGSAARPAAHPRARPPAARRHHRRRQSRARAGRLPRVPAGRLRDRRALRHAERQGRATCRAPAWRSTTSAS